MSFYITLPSDASMHIFPDNTMSHFSTKLPKRLELLGEWEVGLVEIIYPRMWNNITEDGNSYEYNLGNGVKKKNSIPSGFYDSVNEIIDQFEKNIRIKLGYNKFSKKVKLQLTNGATLRLSKGLAESLGFPHDETLGENVIPPGTLSIESPFVADPNVDLHLLYIYADIIQPEMVGDVVAPLLRILTVKGEDGEMVHAQFDRPHYLPLSRKHIESIEIVIRTHSGRYVSFERGKLIVKLHFRLKTL
nr:TPA_asm: penton [Parasteatoda house spider adintovirus]